MDDLVTEAESALQITEFNRAMAFLRDNGVHTTLTPYYSGGPEVQVMRVEYQLAVRGRVVLTNAGPAEVRAVIADLRLALARRIVERATADQG